MCQRSIALIPGLLRSKNAKSKRKKISLCNCVGTVVVVYFAGVKIQKLGWNSFGLAYCNKLLVIILWFNLIVKTHSFRIL